MTTGPNRKYPPPAVLITDYFSLLARIIVSNVAWFVDVVKMIAERAGQPVEDIMDWLLSEWFTHVCVPFLSPVEGVLVRVAG